MNPDMFRLDYTALNPIFRRLSNQGSDSIHVPYGSCNGDVLMSTGLFEVVERDETSCYVKLKGLFGHVMSCPNNWWYARYDKEEKEEKEAV